MVVVAIISWDRDISPGSFAPLLDIPLAYLLRLRLRSLPLLLEHWATRLFHRLRALATLRTPFLLTGISCKSSRKVYRQVFVGRLLLLPPSGTHCIATLAGLSDGSHSICPASVNLLTLTIFDRFSPAYYYFNVKQLAHDINLKLL